MHTYQNKCFFLLFYVFFDAGSKSEIKIFRTVLAFELYGKKERKIRHNKTQSLKYFSMLNPFSHCGHCIGPPSKISILV